MFHLAQPALDEIKSRNNSSVNIDKMSSLEFLGEKNTEALARYFLRLGGLSKASSIRQSSLGSDPGFSVFRNALSLQENITTRLNFEFHLLQESLENILGLLKSEADVTRLARQKLHTIADRQMAEEAEKIIDGLRDALEKLDTSNLPPIRVFEVEDSSLLVEWILPHHRMGFNIDPARPESGWFLVSDNDAQSIQASGLLIDEDIKRLTAWLVEPLIDYYL